MKVVSLLASAYSGSTILSMALGSLPQLCAFGDTYYSPAHPLHRCSCGEFFRECEFRQKMSHAMAKKGFPNFWDTATPLLNNGTKAHRLYFYLKRILPRQYGALNRILHALFFSGNGRTQFVRMQDAFFEVLETETGSDYYFDGCKSSPRAQLMHDCYPDTKVLHLVRDPRGFIASCVKHFKEQTGDVPDMNFVNARLSAWKKYNTLAAGYEQELAPGNYLRIQYADLLSEPVAVLEKILSFIGPIDDHKDLGAFDRERVHISGNKTNLVSSRIEKRVLGDWRKFGDVIDFQHIERQTSNLAFVQFEVSSAERPASDADNRKAYQS